MEGVVSGESPRWHDGRLWFSDWGGNLVLAPGTDGSPRGGGDRRIVPDLHRLLPDGRLLVMDSAQRRLLRCEPDGSPVTRADLSAVSAKPWNDIVVDDQGNAHVNTIGLEFPAASSR
jgi:sugar lactone lactonase YvrE